jgi:excinuclease UvrABC ATPase subunit
MLIARRVLKEVRERLGFFSQVGPTNHARSAAATSRREGKRIRLSTEIG